MCTHQHYIYNNYIRKKVLVPCGKCEACKQERSERRATLIRNNSDGRACFFITLTYDNHYVPYIRQEDLQNVSILGSETYCTVNIPVYRDYNVRWYKNVPRTYRNNKPVTYIRSSELQDLDYIPILTRKRGCMGITYYKDFQDFMKRLRQYITRDYKNIIDNDLQYFAVSEYGGKTFRPHFHLLLYLNGYTKETIRPLIAKAWSFGDVLRTDKRIQYAVNPASYLAGYLNKSAGLPKICESPGIRQKFSHSSFFGFRVSEFSLSSILQKVRAGSLQYSHEIIKDGAPMLVDVPVPKYVISRFFPKFKGYSISSVDEVSQFLLCPEQYWNKFGDQTINLEYDTYDFCDVGKKVHHVVEYSPYKDCLIHLSFKEFMLFVNKFRRCITDYIALTGNTIFDYIIDYHAVWRVWYSTVLRMSFNCVTEWSEHYTNIIDYYLKPSIAPTLDKQLDYNRDPNTFSITINRDRLLRKKMRQQQQIRKTNGLILSELYDDM